MISKWTLLIFVVLAILVVLYFTGKKSVHHELTIDASPEKVWMVLTNTDNYDAWNPVMKLIKGEGIKEGNELTYQFTQDENNKSEIPAKVIRVEANKLLNQAGGIPLILTYNHKYRLEADGNGTKVVIQEDYRGIGVNFWNPKPVEEAYGRLNQALKDHVESLNP